MGGFTQADLDLAKEENTQAGIDKCKNDPASCGIDISSLGGFTQADLDIAKEDARQACQDGPISCDIDNGTETYQPATLSAKFKMHIPVLNYTPVIASDAVVPLWADLELVKDPKEILFRVTGYGDYE